jgi:hypothetical protein
MRGLRTLALAGCAAALLATPVAFACGVCVEDKVAAAYDHGVITRALDRGHVVVFAEVKGRDAAAALTRAARKAALGVRGVDRASVRVAEQPAMLSFALDGKAGTPAEALAAMERAAASRVQLQLLKVMR